MNSIFAEAMGSVKNRIICKQCGIDRNTSTQSQLLIQYADGTTVSVCSLHCAVVEMQLSRDRHVGSLLVADFNSKQMLDVRDTTWVVGGRKNDAMTARAQWAFAKPNIAKRFVKKNGGAVTSYDKAIYFVLKEVRNKAAEEMAVESEMIRELCKL
jgi:hypothetical protein